MVSEKEVWDIALHLWKTLAETEDCEVADGDPSKFKNEILEKLGYGKKRNGCPFCEEYVENYCIGCPIGPRGPGSYGSYTGWSDTLVMGRHSKNLAKKFYDELVELRKRCEK